MNAKKRLIVLANHRQARILTALGLRVQETLVCLSNTSENHPEPLSRSHLGHDKGAADSQFFPPHTAFKDIEKEQFAHEISKEVGNLYRSYDDIVLACEPKMLGLLRKELSHYKLLNIYKAFSLDEVEIGAEELESKILESAEEEKA